MTTERLEALSALYGVSASALVDGNVVTKPSTIDVEHLKLFVAAVQEVVLHLKVNTSPEKMSLAISELYRLEVTHNVHDPGSQFDATRHLGIIEAIFRE